MENELPTREILWNIENSWVMYPCFLAALAIAVFFYAKRYRLWKIGKEDNRSDQRALRLRGAFFKAFLQTTVLKEKGPGIMHIGMYVGFLILFLATAVTVLQADFGLQILYGDFYLYFMSLLVDCAGLVFVVAMASLIIRRLVSKTTESTAKDYIVLVLLFLIGIGGFILEGLRVEGTGDPWRAWSPVGNLVAMAFVSLDDAQIHLAHQVVWWSHMAFAFALIAYWTYSKLVHVFLIPGSVYWRSLEPKGSIPFINLEDENLESIGVGSLEEFTWKDLYDTQACVQCGRCQNNCPAYASGKSLSPQKLMKNLGQHLEEQALPVFSGHKGKQSEQKKAQQASLEKTLVGDTVGLEELWACTTCRSCMDSCPALLEHVPKIVGMRTYQVSMEGSFPKEAQISFKNMETNGNPWGLGWQTRADWSENIELCHINENKHAEYLFWVGCSGSFDERNKKVSRAIVELMQAAQVDFAVLGNEETCCGDAARRMGNEYLYYTLATENIEKLKKYGVKKIITQCPHCYNSLKNDYSQLGADFEVVHHTELFADLIQTGNLSFPQCDEDHLITYHDSCYIGRYNDIYQEPRMLIKSTGASLVEMDKTREKGFCCGAGGGRMWLEETEGERINALRAEQALATKPHTIATACPYCLTMLSDALASKESEVPVKDIAELLAESMG